MQKVIENAELSQPLCSVEMEEKNLHGKKTTGDDSDDSDDSDDNDYSDDMDDNDTFALEVALCIGDDDKAFEGLQKQRPENRTKWLHDTAHLNGSKSLSYVLSNTDEDLAAQRNTDGKTLLHVAVREGVLESVELLLEKCPDLRDAADANGYQAIHRAALRGNADIMKCLIRWGSDVNSTLRASFTENGSMLEHQLQVPVSATNDYKHTPLHLAIRKGHSDCCRLLLDHPTCQVTDVNKQPTDGETLLHAAVDVGVLESVELLMDKWPDLRDTKDADGCQAIHLAVVHGNIDIMMCLIKKGADVKSTSPNGRTALHIASEKGHCSILEYLLKLPGIDVSLNDDTKETPLHLAIREGHSECCRLLLAHPTCKVTGVNNLQQTVLHYVSEYTSESIRWHNIVGDMLQKETEYVVAQDLAGQTPLHVAIQRNNAQLTGIFIEHLKKKSPNGLLPALAIQDNKHQTPFRCMIRTMPELAAAMLDACIEPCPNAPTDQLIFRVDLSLLEDTYEKCNWDGSIEITASPYTKNYRLLRNNHPLNIISSEERHQLLDHPFVKLLLHRKLTWSLTLYILCMFFYASHVISVSVYMILAAPPFQVNQSLCELNSLGDIALNLWNEKEQGSQQTGLTATVVILAALGVISEIMLLVLSGTRRRIDIHNILAWFTYVSAVVIIIDFTKCKMRTDWQWQLGVVCVFLAWMNFLFSLRKAPKVGVYIAMIAMIFKTFMQFFFVFFLFILAFAITFVLLLQNQYAFQDVFLSVIRTWVMMTGEMGFPDIFHNDDIDHHVQVYFPQTTYAVFVVFLIMLSLIIMNLLTGLAIRDVNKLLEDSAYQVNSLQISLALDFEFAIPVWCHRRIVRRNDFLYPPSSFLRLRKAVVHFFYGPVSRDIIYKEAQEIVKRREEQNDKPKVSSEELMNNIMDMIKDIKEKSG